jgi:hypothetical protein
VRTTIRRLVPVRAFDRPVFIIAMPRSGSTLLLDLLRVHPDLKSWGREAYRAWKEVDPSVGETERGEVFDAPLDRAARQRVWASLRGGVRAHEGGGFVDRLGWTRYRLLEKTPSNVLRVDALDALFPDARFIFLTRDAPQNIASLLEGRERSLAVRGYPRRIGVDWHFLMPPGFLDHADEPPAQQFAWQWLVGNETALAHLEAVPSARRFTVRYEDLIADAEVVLEKLQAFAEVDPSDAVAAAGRELKPSIVTLSPPDEKKWHARSAEIEPVLPPLADLRRRLGYL